MNFLAVGVVEDKQILVQGLDDEYTTIIRTSPDTKIDSECTKINANFSFTPIKEENLCDTLKL